MPPSPKRESWIIIDVLGPVILDNVEGCVVEIGCGISSQVFCDLSKKFHRKYYAVDKKKKKIDYVLGLECGEHLTTYLGSSYNFMRQFDEDIALILIDGEHKYSTVQYEVEFFLQKLVVGGVMFIHDTLPPSSKNIYKLNAGDVYLARQDLEQRDNLYTFTWPYTAAGFGLTMVMRKEENAPWYRR